MMIAGVRLQCVFILGCLASQGLGHKHLPQELDGAAVGALFGGLGGEGSGQRPSGRPSERPAQLVPRPAGPVTRPTRPVPRPTRPEPRPTTRPAPRPTTRPAPRPTTRPATRPTTRPAPRPTTRPAPRPTARPAPRPTTRPAPRPTTRPATRPIPPLIKPISRPILESSDDRTLVLQETPLVNRKPKPRPVLLTSPSKALRPSTTVLESLAPKFEEETDDDNVPEVEDSDELDAEVDSSGVLLTAPLPATDRSGRQCERSSGAVVHGDKRYLFSWKTNEEAQLTWQEARSFCQERCMDLDVVGTKREFAFLTQHIKKGDVFGLWVGGKKTSEGIWRWVNGNEVSSKVFADSGANGGPQPDAFSGVESCVAILNNWFEDGMNGLHDMNCIEKFPFVCSVSHSGTHTEPLIDDQESEQNLPLALEEEEEEPFPSANPSFVEPEPTLDDSEPSLNDHESIFEDSESVFDAPEATLDNREFAFEESESLFEEPEQTLLADPEPLVEPESAFDNSGHAHLSHEVVETRTKPKAGRYTKPYPQAKPVYSRRKPVYAESKPAYSTSKPAYKTTKSAYSQSGVDYSKPRGQADDGSYRSVKKNKYSKQYSGNNPDQKYASRYRQSYSTRYGSFSSALKGAESGNYKPNTYYSGSSVYKGNNDVHSHVSRPSYFAYSSSGSRYGNSRQNHNRGHDNDSARRRPYHRLHGYYKNLYGYSQ